MIKVKNLIQSKGGILPQSFRGMLCPVAVCVLMAICGIRGTRAEEIQFNTDVLDVKERTNIDLSQFSQAGYLMPGKYQLTIRVNKAEIPEQTVEFIAPENDPKGSAV